MPRYVNVENIRPYKGFFEDVDNVPKFYKWVENLPTADVVEVVRCKECKHRDGEDGQCPLQTTGDPYLDTYPQNNFYCGDGERRKRCGSL